MLLNRDRNDACTKVRVVKKRYAKRAKCISNKELQEMEKQQEREEALWQIKAIFPQCSKCFYYYKSQKLLDKHMENSNARMRSGMQ